MAYTVNNARGDFNMKAHRELVAANEGLIRNTSESGRRSVQIHFDQSNPQLMEDEMRRRGFNVERTHGGIGMKVSW